jgi:hypothetical protein
MFSAWTRFISVGGSKHFVKKTFSPSKRPSETSKTVNEVDLSQSFTFNRQTKKAELRGGDIGWNEVHEVHGGRAPGLVLSADEQQWLQACWAAATKFTA